MTEKNKFKEYAWFIAEGTEIECGKDAKGDPEFYCPFCLEPMDLGHSEECIVIRARVDLGQEWEDYAQKLMDNVDEVKETLSSGYILCLFCSRKIATKDIKEHFTKDIHCMSIRKRLK